MPKIRLLLPLRSSHTRATGSGLSIEAISRMSSGTREECITDFVPGTILLEFTLPVATEQNLAAGRRHFGMRQHLGEVVDEDVALERADAPHLVVPCGFEIDVGPVDAEAALLEEPLAFHPLQRRLAQVGQMRVVVRKLGLVADDGDRLGMATAFL